MKKLIYGSNWAPTVIILMLLNSCANMNQYHPYARNVKKKPGVSGVIALKQEHRQEDQNLAKEMMGDNCGAKKINIVEEGEVAIGTITESQTKKQQGGTQISSLFGLPVTSSTPETQNQNSTTLQKKEWQITYKCL